MQPNQEVSIQEHSLADPSIECCISDLLDREHIICIWKETNSYQEHSGLPDFAEDSFGLAFTDVAGIPAADITMLLP